MKRAILFVAITCILAGTILVLDRGPFFMTNCGGNNAALTDCSQYAVLAVAMIHELHTPVKDGLYQQFDDTKRYVYNLDLLSTNYLKLIPTDRIGSARFLLKKGDVQMYGESKPEIIIVCNTSFRNVPRRRFFRKPFHAVGYSTGKTGLISPRAFADLDLSKFVDAKQYSEGKMSPSNSSTTTNQPAFRTD